jgi:Na+-driven multidrug efflux pump
LGAGRWDRVGKVAVTGVMFNFVVGGAMIALVYVLNRHALALFLPSTGEAINISVHLNTIVLWSFILFGTSFVLFGVVRATGAVIAPLIMLIVSLWFVRLPFAFLMLNRWHADAIWWSFPFASIVSAALATLYYRYGGWRNVRLGIAEKRPALLPGEAPETAAASIAPTTTPTT